MFKPVVAAILASGIGLSVVDAGEQPYVAFDVIDLGAVDEPDRGFNFTQASYGIALNETLNVAGASLGRFQTTFTNPVSGEVSNIDLDVQLPVRFDVAPDDSVIINELYPDGSELGYVLPAFQFTLRGINESNDMVAAAFVQNNFQLFGVDSNGECNPEASTLSETVDQPVLIDSSGNLNAVSLSGGFSSLEPTAINDDGLVIGIGTLQTSTDDCGDRIRAFRGFTYNPLTQELTDVASLVTEGEEAVRAGSGLYGASSQFVVGYSDFRVSELDEDPQFERRGLYADIQLNELRPVSGLGSDFVELIDVNDNGIAVGYDATAISSNSLREAFVYDPVTDTSTGLGFLINEGFLRFSRPFAVNNHNEIVGAARISTSPDVSHAFLYDDGQMVDLNNLIDCDANWILADARDINEQGFIVGTGSVVIEQDDGRMVGEVRAYMLKPRSEPADRSCIPVVESGGSLGWSIIWLAGIMLMRRKA